MKSVISRGLSRAAAEVANRQTKIMNNMEDKIAQELYGCSYDELDEDERGDVSFEMHDRLGM